jgi:hypothetical protein
VKDETKPAPTAEELAEAIVATAAGARKLLASRLNKKAICLLVQHAMPTNKRCTISQIETVIESAAELERNYLKSGKKGVRP